MSEQDLWHQYFAVILSDFFHGTPFEVETEIDLSKKQQLLDVIVIRKHEGELNRIPPDGFDNLKNHNLITFKSHQETLTAWVLDELISYYVNYRKQYSNSMLDLIPASEFQLYAVAARFPHSLAKKESLIEVKPGVYDLKYASQNIRIIIIHKLTDSLQNANIELLSDLDEQRKFAVNNFSKHNVETSSTLDNLVKYYQTGERKMPKGIKEINDKLIKTIISSATVDQRLEGLKAEDRLKGLAAEDRLKGLAAEDRLKGLDPEQIKAFLKSLEDKN